MTRSYEMPFDEVMEAKTIGLMLTSINAANYIFSELNASDFYSPKHLTIFVVALEAYNENQSLDFDWIVNALSRNGLLEKAGGLEYVTQLCFLYGQSGEHEVYSKHLRNLAQLRSLILMFQKLLSSAAEKNADPDEIIQEAQRNLFHCQGIEEKSLYSAKQIYNDFSEHGDFEATIRWAVAEQRAGRKPYRGVPSGFPLLDETLGYFRKGAIYYIGARTSMGKTTFLLNLIANMIKTNDPANNNFNGYKVGFFNMEMHRGNIYNKLTAVLAELPFTKVDEGKLDNTELELFLDWGQRLKDTQLFIDSQPAITIQQLAARAKKMKINYDVDVICIDYLTCIRSTLKNATKHLQVDEISKGLQALAKELDVPIICLAQLNRQVTGRKDFTPTLSDFRESGSVEEDADACLLIHRPEYYEPNTKPGQIQVIVAKNRIRGQLKKIEFSRKGKSHGDAWEEVRDLGEVVKVITTEFYGQAADDQL